MASIRETLLSLHLESYTGKVTLQKEGITKTIYFKKGVPVFIDSSVRSETLGQLLLEKGKITGDQYRAILEKMETDKIRQGEAIVALGFLSGFEVYEALQTQMGRKFENSFLLEGAEITAEEGDKFLINVTDLPIDFFQSYLAVVNAQRDSTEEAFPKNKALLLTTKGKEYLTSRTLHARETKIIRLLDGRHSIEQVLTNFVGDEEEALSFLEALQSMKFIEVGDAPAVRFQRTAAEVAQEQKKEESSNPDASVGGGRVVEIREPVLPTSSTPIYALVLKLDQPYPKLMGLPAQANRFQVKKSYETMVREYHLDSITEFYTKEEDRKVAAMVFDKLTLAYTVMSDDKRRHEYMTNLQTRKGVEVEPPPKVKAEVCLQKAHMLTSRKKYSEAEVEIRKAIELDPQEAGYRVELAELMMVQASVGKIPVPIAVEQTLREA